MPTEQDVDFEAVYRGTTALVEGLTFIPWDIDGPQPLVVELADFGQIHGEVLDTGCGLGENSLFWPRAGIT
jgi:hypothetical protein